MHFVIFYLIIAFNCFAKEISTSSGKTIFREFFKQGELQNFLGESFLLEKDGFSLEKSLSKLTEEEYIIALSYLFFNKKTTKSDDFSIKDLQKLYLFDNKMPKRDLILSQIKSQLKAMKISPEKFQENKLEIEDVIWFFFLIEDANLLDFLAKNQMTVQEFFLFLNEKQDFEIIKNIILPLEEEISSLLWEGKITASMPLIAKLEEGEKKNILLSRVYFQTKNQSYETLAKSVVDKRNFEDEGLVYDYIKYLTKTEHYKDALKLITQVKINPTNTRFNKFWKLIDELLRYYMEEKDYQSAFNLLANVDTNEDLHFQMFARVKFLAGLISLHFLEEPKTAIPFFELLYNSKNSTVYTKSRGALYMALSYRKMQNPAMEKKWLLTASKFLNTFYGMVALDLLNEIEPILFLGKSKYTEIKIAEQLQKRREIHKFYFDDFFKQYYENSQTENTNTLQKLKNNAMFKVGLLMLLADRPSDANNFFAVSTSQMSLPEVKLAFDFLNSYIVENKVNNGRLILDTFSSKASNQGAILVESYPLLNFVIEEININPNSLIHGVIKQESNFKIQAISNVGAIGLMQIMPSTGKVVSRSANLNFDLSRLKNDYKYNIQIGSYYLELLLNKFGKSYPFVLIGYNAGPNRVSSWQKRYLEPKTIEEMLTFIELIPFSETREYVFRVMENEVIYDYLIEYHSNQSLLPLARKDEDFNALLKQYLTSKKPIVEKKPSPAKQRIQNRKPKPKKVKN